MCLFGKQVTSGASSDLQHATRIARMAVAEWGMSEAIGPVYVDSGRHPASADLERRVDSEVGRVLREAHARVTSLLARPHTLFASVFKFHFTIQGERAEAPARTPVLTCSPALALGAC